MQAGRLSEFEVSGQEKIAILVVGMHRSSTSAEAKVRHLPIGSGVVEAACKTLVTRRLKRSGMRWCHAGACPPNAGIGEQAILTLRALIRSGRFDSAWELLSGTYRREVTFPNNTAPFPCKRAV